MRNEVTKWRSCSLALHPDSAQRWKFEDTTKQKNHSTTLRKYFTSGATSHPNIRHTGLPSSPRSQTNGRLHDKSQSRGDKYHESSAHTNPLRSKSERQTAPCNSADSLRKLRRSLQQHPNSQSTAWVRTPVPLQLCGSAHTSNASCGHAVHCP